MHAVRMPMQGGMCRAWAWSSPALRPW